MFDCAQQAAQLFPLIGIWDLAGGISGWTDEPKDTKLFGNCRAAGTDGGLPGLGSTCPDRYFFYSTRLLGDQYIHHDRVNHS